MSDRAQQQSDDRVPHHRPAFVEDDATSTPLSMSSALRIERYSDNELSDCAISPAPSLPEFNTESVSNEADLTEAEIIELLTTGQDDSADYYTLLGLSRDQNPTDAQIRAAYHRLSLAFHPDKQPPYLKNAAEGHFTRLRRAYETLIEPRKRVIYDLEGEEGVQAEYGLGGAMGPGGEAERQVSQVKVMAPSEFKKWFLGVMRGRERRALEALVEHETNFHIGLDAAGIFTDAVKVVENGDDEITFPLEPLRLTDIGVTSSFSVPLPQLAALLEKPIPTFKQLTSWTTSTINGEEEEEEEEQPPSWTDSLLPTTPSLTLTGGIHGEVDQRFAILDPIRVAGRSIPINDSYYTMTTQNLTLGASISHTFPELPDAPPNSLAEKFQGFNVEVEANILPHPSNFTLGLGKAISFASDTRPFYLGTKFIVRDSPHILPPEVQVQLTRQLGIKGDKTAFLIWHSGERQWPSSFAGLLSPFIPLEWISLDYVARWQTMGQAAAIMRLGILFTKPTVIDEEHPELQSDSADNNTTSVALTAQPNALGVELKHSFDLFSQFSQPPIRSRILNSGDSASPESRTPPLKSRGVKVDLAASVSLPVTLNASLTGRRKFGNFTTMGLSIGVNQNLGLHLSVSWERLGQSISLPVAMLPLDEMTSNSILMAIGVPWVGYTALEFLYLRPRDARKRQRLIKQQRKKLRADVKRRREEAEQAVELMAQSVARRQSVEDADSGLVIMEARWGVLSKDEGSGKWEEGKVVDVTIALAALVDDGQLGLARGLDKSRLIGFWDPAPLERKMLSVDYLFGGKQHHVEVSGGKGLVLPRREHEV